MGMIFFDSLKFASKLENGGFTAQQSKVFADAFHETIAEQLATNTQLQESELKLSNSLKNSEISINTSIKEAELKLTHAIKENELRSDAKHETTRVEFYKVMLAQTAFLIGAMFMMFRYFK